MAIPKLPKDARRLMDDHRRLLQDLQSTQPLSNQYKMQIQEAVDRLLEQQVLATLGNIPVEELSREKKGYRVKTLRDLGYATMEDLYQASEQQLAAINGISDQGAGEIRQVVGELARHARQAARIRISTDNRTAENTALLTALTRYDGCQAPLAKAYQMVNTYRKSVDAACADVEGAMGTFQWMFAGKEKKQRAHQGYTYLYQLMTGSYGQLGRRILNQLNALEALSGEDSWNRFRRDPILFFNTLERVCPGVLGSEDEKYGLPEELAQAVQEEAFHEEGLRCQLRRYQVWGVRYILHQKRVLLGDEMGLGKTVQAIAAMVSLRNTGSRHFLVVCPASVLENWCREIGKHSDLTVHRIHGKDREQAVTGWLRQGGVAVTTYETTGAIRLQDAVRLGMIVVDEAHYIKNPQAQRTANVRRLCMHGEHLLFMTGTAMENRVDEMIQLITVLQPQVAEKVRELASMSSAPLFRQAVAPVYYRRKREDVLTELPDLIEKEQWCTLEPGERQVYESAVLEGSYADARRVSWNAPDLAGSCKARRLLELVEQAREQERKIIVFSFFLDTISRVTGLLGQQCMEPINGSVPPERRQQIVDAFEQAPAGTVLPAQIQAGGTGLNIQAASVVILCEPQFKPSIENQAISRAYRMGQTRNVLVYRLLCEDTVDERITELLEQKQAAFDAFADDSVAAQESLEVDSAGFAGVMEQEKQRITAGKKPA